MVPKPTKVFPWKEHSFEEPRHCCFSGMVGESRAQMPKRNHWEWEMSAPVVFVIFLKLRKSHLILLHVLILQEEPEPQQCTNEHHNFYTENYKDESNCKFCKNSWLEGQQCAGCKKRFVSEKAGEGEFRPCDAAPVYFCLDCKKREVQQRWGNRGKVPGVIHSFCNSCYQSRLSMCSKDTPRSKRSRAADVQKNVDSSSLDPVGKELLLAGTVEGRYSSAVVIIHDMVHVVVVQEGLWPLPIPPCPPVIIWRVA